jgi:diaminopimelate decarboxylase
MSRPPDPTEPSPGLGSEGFGYDQGELRCEQVRIAELAQRFGTPLYVYSRAALTHRLQALRTAFGAEAMICYAVKSNGNLSLLRLLHSLGAGFDIVSGGELLRLQAAGVPAAQVVFAGAGKQRWEIEAAVAAGIAMCNVESPHEIELLRRAAAALGRRVPVALRINPDIEAGSHRYISTGRAETKFGVGLAAAKELVRAIRAAPQLELVGYHVHLGSQLASVEPYARAFDKVAGFLAADPSHAEGVRCYDLGGGFGVAYGEPSARLDVAALAAALLPRLQRLRLRAVLEPGRYLVADAGVLVTTVLGEKTTGRKRFVLVDAAMNDLLRPALYQARHPIAPVRAPERPPDPLPGDVVGPVCETSDFLGLGLRLPALQPGELLAVFAAGAYGASMASNYNSRCRPAEVLVDRDRARLIRRRESFDELWTPEKECLE